MVFTKFILYLYIATINIGIVIMSNYLINVIVITSAITNLF